MALTLDSLQQAHPYRAQVYSRGPGPSHSTPHTPRRQDVSRIISSSPNTLVPHP